MSMSLKNRYNLWKLKIGLAPSLDFKDNLWRDLNSAWNSIYGHSARYRQIGLLRKSAAFAAAVLLLISGTGAYAYISPKVTAGTALYPIKQVVESAEETIKITPEAKAKFYLKQIKRREAEKEILSEKNLRQANIDIKIMDKTEAAILSEATTTMQGVVRESGRIKKIRIKSIKPTERKIKKTEEFIERAVDRLETAREAMEKNGSKNAKLREEVKNRLQTRIEKQKERLNKLEELKEKKVDKRFNINLNR
jgi:hypothetical protein